jgi:hypothetical protein
MPALYDISSFAPSGTYSADAHYHDAGSNAITAQYLRNRGWMVGSVIKPGIYYTTGDITLNENNMTVSTAADGRTGVTFVTANGRISLSGNGHVFQPYTQNLLLFSNKCNPSSPCSNACTTTVIELNGEHHQWKGNIYAPYGRVETNGNNGWTLEGCIYGNTVRLNGNRIQIVCQKSDTPTAPEVLFAE